MMKHRFHAPLLGAAAALLTTACGGVIGGSDGPTPTAMDLEEISNGFGQLVPHQIRELDASGNQTQQIISIRSVDDLTANLRPSNPILPTVQFAQQAILPSGAPGNHFLYARFTRDIDIDSVLDASPGGQSNSGLTGAITVVAIDPISGTSQPVRGRAFVGGRTYTLPAVVGDGGALELTLEQWVTFDEDAGVPVAVTQEDGSQPGLGFPGTQGPFEGAEDLVSDRTLVFVVDNDGNLATHERFPSGVQIRMQVTSAVRATNGEGMARTALGSSTVGPDTLGPEVRTTPPPLNTPLVFPQDGEVDVDPLTSVRIEFTEPVQPLFVGDLDDGTPPSLSSSVLLQFGPPTARTTMPFSVRPISVFDLSTYELLPAFNFPGAGPSDNSCGTFNIIDIVINPGQLADLVSDPVANPDTPNNANINLLGGLSSFQTGAGPGIVNVPVLPDALYLGRTGGQPGISIVDLNGFGQGTGNPVYDPTGQVINEGDTNFPNNPNVRFQGAQLRPSLQPGTCTINGGSAGAFTLAKDSSLNDLLSRAPILSGVTDMMIGQPLDTVFNNAPFPFGCQSGGGQLCTTDGLKLITAVNQPGSGVTTPQTANQGALGVSNTGAGNVASWAPHPNPPPIIFPPLCISPFLGTQEPSSIDNNNINNPLNPGGLSNLLVPGDAFGDPDNGVPPSGLLTLEQNAFFIGPSLPQAQLQACAIYSIRQQVGQFLYVADRQRREVLVLNSNRMTVVDRIPVSDPTALAMGTNVDFLAVTNQQADTVAFIDVDPGSATFHTVVAETVVGSNPRGIAWETGNEDILVCNEGDNSVSIISAGSLALRRTVQSQLDRPFDVVTTPRERDLSLTFARNVYFAYILNRSGVVALFESGPNGVNGWGFDDVIGVAASTFQNPKTLQVDHTYTFSGCWVAHEGPINPETQQSSFAGLPAVSNFVIESALAGQQVLTNVGNPGTRSMQLGVRASFGPDRLTGIPVDLAFDNLRNLTGLPNSGGLNNTFSFGIPAPLNGKRVTRAPGGILGATNILPSNTPRFMFVAVPNAPGTSGVVDVIDLSAGGAPKVDVNAFQPGVQSIQAPNVIVLSDYFRQ